MTMELARELEEMLETAKDYQQSLLLRILRDNEDCQYFKDHGFSLVEEDIHVVKSLFKEMIPISDYSNVEEYIRHVAEDGDPPSLLLNYPILMFCISSGTTAGKSKKFPCPPEYFELYAKAHSFTTVITERAKIEALSKGVIKLREPKILSLAVAGKQHLTKGGYIAGALTTNVYRGETFRSKYKDMGYCSPIEVVLCGDSKQALYCHLLCGLLKATDVWCFDASYSFVLDMAIHVFRSKWQQLCRDICNGTLSPEITDEKLREAMQHILTPSPQIADAIQRECSKSDWKGILRRIWPNAIFIQCKTSGPTMKKYLPTISYYSDNLPVYGHTYASTEGGRLAICMDINRSPDTEIQYTLLPNMAFYEFLPLKKVVCHDPAEEMDISNGFVIGDTKGKLETLQIGEVQIGEYYQPVITTFQGLYRYELPDIIKITGFHAESPIFELVCRKNTALEVGIDKTDEAELEIVLRKASLFLAEHGISLIEYTSSVDMSCAPAKYVIFMEIVYEDGLEMDDLQKIMEECCCLLDSLFNRPYKIMRNSGNIGPLKVCVVERGTYEELMEERLMKGVSLSQYKPPRAVPWNSTVFLPIFNAVVKTYTSSLTSLTVPCV